MTLRKRTTRIEHEDDLRTYYASFGAINGLSSSLGYQLERLRDGVSDSHGCPKTDDRLVALIDPGGKYGELRAVYNHIRPVLGCVPNIHAEILELQYSSYPNPAWLKHPTKLLAVTNSAKLGFSKAITTWRKSSKKAGNCEWTPVDYVDWLVLRCRDQNGKTFRKVVALMTRDADALLESALSCYEESYRKIYT